VNDEVHRSGKLIAARAVIECSGIVGMIEPEFGPDGNNLVRPPGDADGVF